MCFKLLHDHFYQFPKKSPPTNSYSLLLQELKARHFFYQFNSGHMIKAILGSSSIMHIPFNPDIYYYKVSSTIQYSVQKQNVVVHKSPALLATGKVEYILLQLLREQSIFRKKVDLCYLAGSHSNYLSYLKLS